MIVRGGVAGEPRARRAVGRGHQLQPVAQRVASGGHAGEHGVAAEDGGLADADADAVQDSGLADDGALVAGPLERAAHGGELEEPAEHRRIVAALAVQDVRRRPAVRLREPARHEPQPQPPLLARQATRPRAVDVVERAPALVGGPQREARGCC